MTWVNYYGPARAARGTFGEGRSLAEVWAEMDDARRKPWRERQREERKSLRASLRRTLAEKEIKG